jgi:2-methylcitrate dehydratase PrpD
MLSSDTSAARATAELASFIAEARFQDLPAEVVERAELIVADTVGVALHGSREPEMQALYGRLPSKQGAGGVVYCASPFQTDPAMAAMANVTAACFLELDEGSRPSGHPAIHALPSALAYAQAESRSGADFLAAFVLGYEVQARIQWSCRLRWPVHPHGNMGNPAAIAALGKLAGWDAEQIRHGMNAGAGLAMGTSWEPCLVGATIRNAYAGMTAQIAFAVKPLIESGFTAYDGAFAETYGEILGEQFDANALIDGLGDRWLILDSYFKFHAACALTHPILDAVADALGAPPQGAHFPPFDAPAALDPELIRRVEIRAAERSSRLQIPAQGNQLSAKFSIPFAVATYLVHGNTGPESFRGDALHDERVLALAERVDLVGDSGIAARWPAEAAAEATVELEDGRMLSGSCANPYGSTRGSVGVEDLRAKFEFLTDGVLPAASRAALWDAALSLDRLDDMARFAPD